VATQPSALVERVSRQLEKGLLMVTRKCGTRIGVALSASIVLSLLSAGAAQAQSLTATVVVSGLNNPRQLALTKTGDLLIAEAGNGGGTKIGKGKGAQYVGPSGSVSLVTDPSTGSNESPDRILTGFLSSSSKGGAEAVGSDGVSANSLAAIYVQETYFGPNVPPFFPDQEGQLLVAAKHGVPTEVTNISSFNQSANPDGQPFDSDPYAVLITGSGTELVADAAANDIVSVSNGEDSVFHWFPNVTAGKCAKKADPNRSFPGCNFVPTALAQNKAGDVFVTGLVSLVPGAGEVVELDPTGASVLNTWTGFTAPDGIAVDKAGDIYVSQLLAPEANPPVPQIAGVVTEIPTSGSDINTDVPFPSGLVLDKAGNLYVSAFSIAPSTGLGVPDTSGEVLRLTASSSD
jgi:hypothetical protein